MDTNKVAYWVALGVLALGLNSEYRHGNFVALHQAVERADFAMCGVTTRAERTLAAAIGVNGQVAVCGGGSIGIRQSIGRGAPPEQLVA